MDDEIEAEYPRLLRRGLEVLVEKRVREPFEVATELCLSPDDISELASLNAGYFSRPSGKEVEVLFRAGGGEVGATEEYGIKRHFTPQSLN